MWSVFRLYLAPILTYNGERYIVRRVLKWRVTYARKFSGRFRFTLWKTVRVSSAMLRLPRWKMEQTGKFSSLWYSPFQNAFNDVSLVAEMNARYKRKTKAFHIPRGSFFAYIPRSFSRTVASNISLDASWNGEWHRLENFPVRSISHREKRRKRYKLVPLCSVFHIFHNGKWNGP